jgi:hypothetical protein
MSQWLRTWQRLGWIGIGSCFQSPFQTFPLRLPPPWLKKNYHTNIIYSKNIVMRLKDNLRDCSP